MYKIFVGGDPNH